MAWSNIIGHDHWVNAFRTVAGRGRLAHAYLFVGPEGIGKRMFAIELARALLCEKPPAEPLTACGVCSACLLVDAKTHPDLFLVGKEEDANELKIEVVRDLCINFRLKSARGHGKVAILDDADDMNEDASNCFLKTLEEPPPRSVFILLGTTLEQQLPTIRSRCQAVRFAPLPGTLVRTILERDEEIERGLIPQLVRLANGSPGQARLLADPKLWEFRNKLVGGLSRGRLDSVAVAGEFVKFVEEAGKEGSLQRRRTHLMLKLLLAAIRDVIRIGLGDGDPAAPADEAQLFQALAVRANPEKWMAVVDRVLQAEVQIDRYIQLALILEGLLESVGQILDRP